MESQSLVTPDDVPVIGIAPDLGEGRARVRFTYLEAVRRAGGLPIVLPPCPDQVGRLVQLCHGVMLIGGDDPIMEDWGLPTHPRATRVEPERQAFDLAVLAEARRRDMPVLAICLGMQYLGLECGAELDQHLPDALPSAQDHAGSRMHEVTGALGSGQIHSHHHQALRSPGTLEVIARAHDGVIEAVRDPQASFCVGVQWHPERTGPGPLGDGLFNDFLNVVRSAEVRHEAGFTAG